MYQDRASSINLRINLIQDDLLANHAYWYFRDVLSSGTIINYTQITNLKVYWEKSYMNSSDAFWRCRWTTMSAVPPENSIATDVRKIGLVPAFFNWRQAGTLRFYEVIHAARRPSQFWDYNLKAWGLPLGFFWTYETQHVLTDAVNLIEVRAGPNQVDAVVLTYALPSPLPDFVRNPQIHMGAAGDYAAPPEGSRIIRVGRFW